MVLKYTFAWIPMVFIAIANGAARQLLYGSLMSELAAHQVSCFTAIALFFLYTYMVSGRWRLESSRQAWTVGVMWLFLTITFEFVFGHYVTGHSFSRLLYDYNILAGRLWTMVLIVVAVMPYTVYKIRS